MAIAFYFGREFARSTEQKASRREDTFSSELLKSPHCPDPGLDHRFFRAVGAFIERRLIKASDGMSTTLNWVGNLVLCEAVWDNG